MARRSGGSSIPAPIMLAIGITIGLLIVAAIITLAPGLGSQVESATPAPGATSTWNATCRSAIGLAALPRGSDFFQQNVGLVKSYCYTEGSKPSDSGNPYCGGFDHHDCTGLPGGDGTDWREVN